MWTFFDSHSIFFFQQTMKIIEAIISDNVVKYC